MGATLAIVQAVTLFGLLAIGGLPQVGKGGASELYSWPDDQVGWAFQLLPHTNRNKTMKEVFDAPHRIRGIEELKKRIERLPRGTTVYWYGRLSTGSASRIPGSETLILPPSAVIDEIRRGAEAHGVVLNVIAMDPGRP